MRRRQEQITSYSYGHKRTKRWDTPRVSGRWDSGHKHWDDGRKHKRIRRCDDARKPCEIERLTADMLCNILERVPVRTIYRSRLVSKFWNASIGDHDWSPVWNKEQPWIVLREGNAYKLWFSASDTEESWHHRSYLPKVFCTSVGGLTVYYSTPSEKLGRGYYVGNPLTNQFRLVANPLCCIRCIPDLCDVDAASGTYKLVVYEGNAAHVYDRATGEWDFRATDERFLQQGFAGCLQAASLSQEMPLAFFVKQFEFDNSARLSALRHNTIYERQWRGGRHYPPLPPETPARLHTFNWNGRCIGGVLAIEEKCELVIKVYELLSGKGTWTWTLLGHMVLDPQCGRHDMLKYFISCAEGLVAFWSRFDDGEIPGPPPHPPVVFNVATLTWKRFKSGTKLISIFKPNLLLAP